MSPDQSTSNSSSGYRTNRRAAGGRVRAGGWRVAHTSPLLACVEDMYLIFLNCHRESSRVPHLRRRSCG